MRPSALPALLLAPVLAGCSADRADPPPVKIPAADLEPEAQAFRTRTAFADNVLSIEVRHPEGGTRTLNTVLHQNASWGQYLPRPALPGHSSREWLLTDNHHDGKVLLYATASWNEGDPGDYLAAGWWLVYPPDAPGIDDFESATRGVFIDGPEIDPARPPDLPGTGTASWTGGIGGLYTYAYGHGWEDLAGSSESTEFHGLLALTANFEGDSIDGCLGCVAPIDTAPGRHLWPAVPWQGPDPAALPAGYDITFSAPLGADGAFEGTTVAVTHPERTVTRHAGTWRGQLSNLPDATGVPRRAVGSTDVRFAEDDGSHGRFTGIFEALTQTAVAPDGGDAN